MVLSVELPSPLLIKLKHFQVSDSKLFLSSLNHFPKILISIRFQHAISPIRLILARKFFLGKLIPKSHNFKLPIVTHEDIPNKQII